MSVYILSTFIYHVHDCLIKFSLPVMILVETVTGSDHPLLTLSNAENTG